MVQPGPLQSQSLSVMAILGMGMSSVPFAVTLPSSDSRVAWWSGFILGALMPIMYRHLFVAARNQTPSGFGQKVTHLQAL